MEAQGLDWTIDLEQQDPTKPEDADTRNVFGLIQPESGKPFGTVVVSSEQFEEFGRHLNVSIMLMKSQLTDAMDTFKSWEGYQNLMALSTRLYGGFTDPDELYNACAKTEMVADSNTLYEGTLTGGYCLFQTNIPLQDWSPFSGGGGAPTLRILMFESEEAYQHWQNTLKQLNP